MTGEQLGQLFCAFQQADGSTTRRFGGSGLGLRISRSLANLLGGDITASSEAGAGSRFIITIPTGKLDGIELEDSAATSRIRPVRIAEAVPVEGPMLAGLRIFLVEDSPAIQKLVEFHLRNAGAEVRAFDDGSQALKALTTDGTLDGPLIQPSPCDLLVTDMQMPVMDGYTLARTLRNKGWWTSIVALTAHAGEGECTKCLNAGCDAYASKPISQETLLQVCHRWAIRERPADVSPLPSAPTAPKRSREIAGVLLSQYAAQREMAGLIDFFLDNLQTRVTDIRALVKSGRMSEVAKIAHQLKGSGGGYGFPEVTDVAKDIEQLAKVGEVTEHLQHAVSELQTITDKALRGRAQTTSAV